MLALTIRASRGTRMLRTIATIVAALTLAACTPEPPAQAPTRDHHPTITRDAYGVATSHGRDDAEAAYGLAMAHAEDNFATIQLVILAARGRLGAHLGEEGAKSDFLWNLLGVKDAVDHGYDQLSPEFRAVIEGYAAGLNA